MDDLPKRVEESWRRLAEQGLIEIFEEEDGSLSAKLTSKGRERVEKRKRDRMT